MFTRVIKTENQMSREMTSTMVTDLQNGVKAVFRTPAKWVRLRKIA